MFEVLQAGSRTASWWNKGDSQLEWWNHGSSSNIMDGNGDKVYSSLQYKPSYTHGISDKLGDSSIYANNFSTKGNRL